MGIDRRRIANVCIVDGMIWSPKSTTHRIEELLRQRITRLNVRIQRLYDKNGQNLPAEQVLGEFDDLHLPEGSLVVGTGIGGILASAYQDLKRPDLHVIAICSPSSLEDISLKANFKKRVELTSAAAG